MVRRYAELNMERYSRVIEARNSHLVDNTTLILEIEVNDNPSHYMVLKHQLTMGNGCFSKYWFKQDWIEDEEEVISCEILQIP